MRRFFVFIMMQCTFNLMALTETVNGITWTYTKYGNNVTIGPGQYNSFLGSGDPAIYQGTSGEIIIPSIIDGYTVTSIGQYAFINCSSLTRVTFPDSIKTVGSMAFYRCTSIKEVNILDLAAWCKINFDPSSGLASNPAEYAKNFYINGVLFDGDLTIPDNVTTIGTNAFYKFNSLLSVTIPNGVKIVNPYAFRYCKSLKKVRIPNGVIIESSVFDGCTNVTEAVVPGWNCSIPSYSLRSVEISEGTTVIMKNAFSSYKVLASVLIPDSVTSIEDSAFSGCEALEKIIIPSRVTDIGKFAFTNCASLLDVGIPQIICTSTMANIFPASYHSITNIVLADNITRIGAECFKDCFEVKRIVIPASVTAIYDNAFKNCSALEEIVFLGDAPDVGSDILLGTPRSLKITVKEGSVGWKGGVSTELPEAWPVGDATARGISYYDDSADVAAMTPVITPADGSIFADTCEVSISCAMEGAKIYYRTDGKTPKFTDAYLYKGEFTISDTSRIVAVAVKEGMENGIASAILTKRVLTLAEAAGDADLAFTTGGAADWVPIGDLTATDGVSARSGTVGDEEESWMELSVSGSGTLTFNWKVSCEDDPVSATWDHLAVFVDGKEREDLCFDGETGWENASIVFDSEGNHTVRWVYVKDESDFEGEDCAWISGVTWKPVNLIVDIGEGKSVVVPTEWIDKYDSVVTAAGGDKAVALQQTAANGRKVWECFMLGVDPTKADDDFKITRFWMEGGKPMFEFSHSADGVGNSFAPKIKVKGKAELSDGWSDVPEGGNSAFRFFTVEVALP